MANKFYFDAEFSVSLKFGMRDRIKAAYRQPNPSNKSLRDNFDDTCRCISDLDYMNKCSLLDINNRVLHMIVKKTVPTLNLGEGVSTYFVTDTAWNIFNKWMENIELPLEFRAFHPNIAKIWDRVTKKMYVTDDVKNILQSIVNEGDVILYRGADVDPTFDKDKMEHEFHLGWNWEYTMTSNPTNVFNDYKPDFTDYYGRKNGYNGYDWFIVNGVIKNAFDTFKII